MHHKAAYTVCYDLMDSIAMHMEICLYERKTIDLEVHVHQGSPNAFFHA